MKKFKLVIILMWLMVWIVSCVPRNVTVKAINKRTGEAIAVDNLLQKYENEHQEFYKRELRDGNGGDDYLKWPSLDSKNLSIYCRKYLQHSISSRLTDNTAGYKFRSYLHYERENIGFANEIVIVQCKVTNGLREVSYYMARAPTPNCIYALKRTGNYKKFIFTVINKSCDFEDKSFRDKSIMINERDEIIKTVHKKTGQPIAKDKYLLKYELEHEKLLRTEGVDGKRIDWPHVILHDNLDSYCYQYMKVAFPRKNSIGVKGTWKTEKLHYQKLDTHEDIYMTAVTCVPLNVNKCSYYVTRACESNCVYALLRQGKSIYSPLVIIFKHCGFENTINHQMISQDYNVLYKNPIPKTEVKEEILGTIQILEVLPND